MFTCHMNEEVCSSDKSIEYLHEYMYKRHDAATVAITNSTVKK